jgi:flagellar biosynthesis regulator FlbT
MGNKFLKQINNLIIIESIIKVLQILEIDQTFLGHHAFRALKATRAIYKNP